LAMGGRFLRAARFSFLRSCLSWIFVVSISAVSFSFTSEVGAVLVAARFVLQCCPLFPTETVAEQPCLQYSGASAARRRPVILSPARRIFPPSFSARSPES
jgi:hypothetical protein